MPNCLCHGVVKKVRSEILYRSEDMVNQETVQYSTSEKEIENRQYFTYHDYYVKINFTS